MRPWVLFFPTKNLQENKELGLYLFAKQTILYVLCDSIPQPLTTLEFLQVKALVRYHLLLELELFQKDPNF